MTMQQTPATDIYNQQVFDLLAHNLTKIVEVGTGSGALCKAYKLVNPGIQYIGVEIDQAYSDLSKRYCDRVYLENFESPSAELMSEIGSAQALIFSDVLEHMYDPWKCLRHLSQTVSDDCLVIASIPNIQHWSIQVRLLNGDFEYASTGLLDQTHIRFFTRKTMETLFEKNGFKIQSMTPRIFDFPNQDVYLKWISDNAVKVNLDPTMAMNDAAVFQFVIGAQKQTTME
jgi:2-polyprenyl-3-methyl-5-hydroxy-6-metoxy-1,4-benzoquinol methylase